MHRTVLWCAALAACGRVDFSTVDASGDGDDNSAACVFSTPGFSSLTDNFSDGLFEPNWTNGSGCMVEAGGELVASPPANMSGIYCQAGTLGSYHLGCDSLFVHVPQTTTATFGAQTAIYVRNDVHAVVLLLDNGGFSLGYDKNDAATVFIPDGYDATRDAWWRLAGVGKSVRFDTSPDGMTWTARGKIDVPFALDNLGVALAAGTYQSIPDPGTARFRCYNLPPPCS